MSKQRFLIINIILVLAMLAFIIRLVDLQIVRGDEYLDVSERRLVRSVPKKAPRGEIFDRYGRPLVTNRLGFTVTFHREYISGSELNDLILKVINVVERSGDDYSDGLPISYEVPFDFQFPGVTSQEEIAERAKQFLRNRKLSEGMTANDLLVNLEERYSLSNRYTPEEARRIIGVRLEMENRMFNNSTPYTFATDVSSQTVAALSENKDNYTGVFVDVEPIREYTYESLASHILGRVGLISPEEFQQYKDKNYGYNDLIGKDGIERILESELRGEDGNASVSVKNVNGKITRIMDTQQPITGNCAILTIDAKLQQVLEESLERNINELKKKADTRDASAGAAVIIDVNSGEILAMASYPTFSLARFNRDFTAMNSDPLRPMINRAISGAYAPGSTFKILTAVAALEEGTISVRDTIRDEGIYRFYSGYQPVCWIWADYRSTHGFVNVERAIEGSCNYFFYEVGRRLTIDSLAKYGALFGLGEPTGVELSGESMGLFASRENREKVGKVWYPGDTLQASIGQSDHLFTPLQLANYIATIANGGTRYKAHLIKGIKSYTDSAAGKVVEPEIVEQVKMSDENYRAVINGMRKVSESGTASNIFSNYHIGVGGKTGTASVPSGTANGLFVAFAPFDDPQIAIAIVVEHGGHGNSIAPIARDVFDSYLSVERVEDSIGSYNTLLP